MGKRHRYTEEQDEFIKNNYTTVSECVSKFNNQFATNISYGALKGYANKKLKIVTGIRFWTEEMDNFIESELLKYPYKEATTKLNERFNINLTIRQVQEHCVYKGFSRKQSEKLRKVDILIQQNVGKKEYSEIREMVNKEIGMMYGSDTTICRRANNLGLNRPHRKWNNATDRRFIDGEQVSSSEYIRFIGHRFHRLEKELRPLARQIVKLQYELSNKG